MSQEVGKLGCRIAQVPLYLQHHRNHIGGLIVSVLTSSALDCGFESLLGQTNDYKIDICCFSAKHVELRRKRKDWLVWNQDNVSQWSDMSIFRQLLQ